MTYLNNILMLLISPVRLRVITWLWGTATNNVASDVQSEWERFKYSYKDNEHTEKSTSLNRFFFSSVHISYKTSTSTVFT